MKHKQIRFILYFVVFLVCCGILYLKYHSEILYKNLGWYYYNKGNAEKSLVFVEKALRKGITDSKTRDLYVNTIINIPLTVENQQKLLDIVSDNIDDSASKTAELFLHNLKKELHNKYPNNYIEHATYSHQIVHWGRLPITYSIKNAKKVPIEYIKEIDNAFNEWERASSCRVYFTKEDFDNSDIIVEFITKPQEQAQHGNKYVIAYTTPNIINNKLKSMRIKFNTINPGNEPYTPNQIYNTALHEIFHALGFMGHSLDSESIMYMTKDSYLMINDDRAKLNSADKKTLELLYKIKPNITNDDKLTYDYIPYLILGDNESRNNAKKIEAKKYINNAPNLPGGYVDLAEIQAGEGKYIDAIHNLEKGLRIADSDEVKYIILYNIAVCYYKIDFFDLAMDYAKSASEIKNSDELEILKAEIFQKTSNKKEYINIYSNLVKDNPNNIDYVIILANIYIKEKKYFKARAVLKKYLKNNPKDKYNSRLKPYGILLW